MEDNSFQIVTRGRKPLRRGISIDEYPSGGLNFWIPYGLFNPAFNFMLNISGANPKKLVSINKNGDVYVSGKVGVGITNPSSPLDVRLPAGVQLGSVIASFKSPYDTNMVFIVPALQDNDYNNLSKKGDVGIFWKTKNPCQPGIPCRKQGGSLIIAPFLQGNNNPIGVKITRNGYVGINAKNPEATLHVGGDAYIENTLGIGIKLNDSNNPKNYKLAVNGAIGAKDIYVELQTPWPDYVFESSYNFLSLTELERYIAENKHLPDIPTVDYIKENGLSLAEINVLLVKKIEELTLYIIELNKRIEKLEKHEK